jgi:hypothetical protein
MRKFGRSKFGSNFRGNQQGDFPAGNGATVIGGSENPAYMVGVNMEGEEGEGGGGDNGSTTFSQDQLTAAVADAVKAATDGAAATSAEHSKKLLAETKAAKEAASKWKDMDFDQVSNMMKMFGESEEAKLISEGKWEEVVTKRIDKQAAQWEQDRGELTASRDEHEASSNKYKTMYETKLTDIQIRQAAEKAGVISTAVDDIVTRGLQIFKVDGDGNLEARDGSGELMKTASDLLLTPELFLEGLKTNAPHYWPQGQGSGGDGNTGGAGNSGSGSIMERKAAAANRGDMVEFKRLDALGKEEKMKNRG